jgi:hypothetical protein
MSSSPKTIVRAYQNYINGQWVKSSSGEMFPVYDPSIEEVIAHVASGTAADVDSAVKAARAAFDSGPWRQTTATDRGRLLYKLAEKTLRHLPNWSAATPASPSSRRSTTSPMPRPVSNTTPDSPTKFSATSIRYLPTP